MTKPTTPHRAAVFAAWHWCARYARFKADPSEFWSSLTPSERAYAREAVREVCGARAETRVEASRA